jgi:hypothetical protein
VCVGGGGESWQRGVTRARLVSKKMMAIFVTSSGSAGPGPLSAVKSSPSSACRSSHFGHVHSPISPAPHPSFKKVTRNPSFLGGKQKLGMRPSSFLFSLFKQLGIVTKLIPCQDS